MAIVPLGLTYQVNNDYGFNSFKKSVFQKNSPLDELGSKFDLYAK